MIEDPQAKIALVHQEAIAKFGMKPEDLAISLIVLGSNGTKSPIYHVNGDQNMYPASVVKLFYAGYLVTLLDGKSLKLSSELERATKDMLFESSNDATGLILDVVTDTTGGAELNPKDLENWMYKRQAVNRWLERKGYSGQNACQKTWNEGPYGREKQGYGPNMELRNSLDANACVRMMAEFALDEVASPEQCRWARQFMLRKVDDKGVEAGGQTKGFIGEALPKSWEWYSKAGWAYKVRHDVAYVKPPKGHPFVLCIFSDNHGSNEALLPFIGKHVSEYILTLP